MIKKIGYVVIGVVLIGNIVSCRSTKKGCGLTSDTYKMQPTHQVQTFSESTSK